MNETIKISKKRQKTPYQLIADKYGVTVRYVGKIYRGEREALRGTGLLIKQEIESIEQKLGSIANTN